MSAEKTMRESYRKAARQLANFVYFHTQKEAETEIATALALANQCGRAAQRKADAEIAMSFASIEGIAQKIAAAIEGAGE